MGLRTEQLDFFNNKEFAMNRTHPQYWVLAALAVLAIGALGLGAIAQEKKKGDEGEWKAPSRAARKKNPLPADDKSVARGRAIYGRECRACHGPSGSGDGSRARDVTKKPADLTNSKMWDQTDGALFWKITEGKKPMPSFEGTLAPKKSSKEETPKKDKP